MRVRSGTAADCDKIESSPEKIKETNVIESGGGWAAGGLTSSATAKGGSFAL